MHAHAGAVGRDAVLRVVRGGCGHGASSSKTRTIGVKWALRRLCYRQRKYRARAQALRVRSRGAWAPATSAWRGSTFSPKLQVTDSLYEITANWFQRRRPAPASGRQGVDHENNGRPRWPVRCGSSRPLDASCLARARGISCRRSCAPFGNRALLVGGRHLHSHADAASGMLPDLGGVVPFVVDGEPTIDVVRRGAESVSRRTLRRRPWHRRRQRARRGQGDRRARDQSRRRARLPRSDWTRSAARIRARAVHRGADDGGDVDRK